MVSSSPAGWSSVMRLSRKVWNGGRMPGIQLKLRLSPECGRRGPGPFRPFRDRLLLRGDSGARRDLAELWDSRQGSPVAGVNKRSGAVADETVLTAGCLTRYRQNGAAEVFELDAMEGRSRRGGDDCRASIISLLSAAGHRGSLPSNMAPAEWDRGQ